MPFDHEQTEAKDLVGKDLGRSIIVSASAGAGKTTVLVARIVKRCLQEGIAIRRIMAVTFTKAAAAEMKRRVFTSLQDALKEAEGEKAEYIRAQIADLNAADITTIDSWCLSIIRKYCNVIGLDPQRTRRIVDEGSLGLLHDMAFDEAFEEIQKENPEAALALAEIFDPRCEKTDELKKAVWKVLDMALSADDPDVFLQEKCLDNYPHVHRLKDFPPHMLDLFFLSYSTELNDLRILVEQVKEFCMDNDFDPAYGAACDVMLKQYDISLSALAEHDWTKFLGTLTPLKRVTFKAVPRKKSGADEALMTDYSELKKPYSAAFKAFLSSVYSENVFVNDANRMAEIVPVFVELCRKTSAVTSHLKEKNACMDFGDLERFALMILDADHGLMAERIKESYDEIMIDEFQDTSELQNAIIERIARRDNVFRVGDVKQSIYRFRQAKPSLMRGLLNEPEDQYHISLNHNYRSQQSLVQWNNDLYQILMNIDGFEDTYQGDDVVAIGEGTGQKEDPVPVEFHMSFFKGTDMSGDEMKAEWIVRKIMTMKKESEADPDPKKHLSYKDFAILTPSHGPKRILNTVFDRYGIPINAITKTGFYNSVLCQTVKAVIACMYDESDSVSLAIVLSSELFGLKEKDFMALRRNCEAAHPSQKYSFVKAVKESGIPVYDLIHYLHETAVNEGVTAFLKQLGLINDFYEQLNSQEKANYEALFTLAMNSEPLSLDTFYETLVNGEDDASLEANSHGADEDAVTVSTFHHSKGIQYPIVFIWSYRSFASDKGADALMALDDQMGLGLKAVDPIHQIRRGSVQYCAIHLADQRAEAQEHIRRMYVATTRAKNRMFLVDAVDNENTLYKLLHTPIRTERKGMSQLVLSVMGRFDRKTAQQYGEADGYLVAALQQKLSGCYPYFRLDTEEISDDETADCIKKKEEKGSAVLPALTVKQTVLPPLFTPSSTEFTYLPPLDPDMRRKHGGTDYGTRMHEMVEQLPDRVWTLEDIRDPDLSIKDKERLVHFSESEIYQACLRMEIHKEYSFFVIDEENNHTIHGAMDLAAFDDKHIILIDFKTDHLKPEEIRERYSVQLLQYRRALELMMPGRDISVYAYSFHNEIFIPIQ